MAGVRQEIPALAEYNGQHYAVAFGARLRWKVKRPGHDWSVLTTKGSIPGWAFAPLWTRSRGIAREDGLKDWDRWSQSYRERLDHGVSSSEFQRQPRDHWIGIYADDLQTMVDWPAYLIGHDVWRHELGRRRNGLQPYGHEYGRRVYADKMRWMSKAYREGRLPTDDECLKPFK